MTEEEKSKLEEGESGGESEPNTEELLELPDTELKEKYGIEDPKNWKSYQRALHKEQLDRTDEREKFQSMLDDRDDKFNQVIESHKQELESLKPKPVEEKFEPPKRSGTDDPEDEFKYLSDTIEYNNKVNDKRFKVVEEQFLTTKKELTDERKLKEEQRNLEMVKSTSKGIWMQGGDMTLEEAEECWNWQSTVKADDRIKTIGKMFKLNKGDGGSELAEELKRREEMKLEGAVPGAGAGGGAGETINPKQYTKDADHTDIYKTK